MNDIAYHIFGEGKDLHPWQMASRAVVMFFLALIMIRISGRRSFGLRSPFDNTISILLGAVLSRAVVGVSPFWSTVTAGFALVVLHRLVGWISIRSAAFSRFAKGKAVVLYENGEFHSRAMQRNLISRHDLLEAIRAQANTDSLDGIQAAYLERNGQISIIKKEE